VLNGQHHAPAALQRKERLYPFNSRLSGPQSQAGRFGEDKNPLHVKTNKARIEIVTFRALSNIGEELGDFSIGVGKCMWILAAHQTK